MWAAYVTAIVLSLSPVRGVLVSTTDSFVEAVQAAASHIFVTGHFLFQHAGEPPLINNQTSVISGNCTDAMVHTSPLLPASDGTCLILAHVPIFALGDPEQLLWLNAVYLKADKAMTTSSAFIVMDGSASQRLWMSRVVLDGSAFFYNSAPGFIMKGDNQGFPTPPSSVLMQGCDISGFRSVDGAAAQIDGLASLLDTRVVNNTCTDDQGGAVLLLGSTAQLLLAGSVMMGNKEYNVKRSASEARVWGEVTVYDAPSQQLLAAERYGPQSSPSSEFLTWYDGWITQRRVEYDSFLAMETQGIHGVASNSDPAQPGYSPGPNNTPLIGSIVGLAFVMFLTGTIAYITRKAVHSWRATKKKEKQAMSAKGSSPVAAHSFITPRNSLPPFDGKMGLGNSQHSYQGSEAQLIGPEALMYESNMSAVSAASTAHLEKMAPRSSLLHVVRGASEMRPVSSNAQSAHYYTGTGTAVGTTGTGTAVGTESICSQPGGNGDPVAALEDILDYLRNTRQLLYDKYMSLGAAERRCGGQGLVQFAVVPFSGNQYALKFFLKADVFEREKALYLDATVSQVCPKPVEVVDASCHINETSAGLGSVGKPSWKLPPCIVTERGQSLDEFANGAKRERITMIQALILIVQRLEILHNAGWVHRDLKPSNILRMPKEHSWTIIDFGSCARAGKVAPISFTLMYAAPEYIIAAENGKSNIVAHQSSDIWAFGVIAYELLANTHTFKSPAMREDIFNQLSGRAPLPWEYPSPDCDKRLSRLMRLKSSILACLSRNPSHRPTASQLAATWNSMFQAVTGTCTQTEVYDYYLSHSGVDSTTHTPTGTMPASAAASVCAPGSETHMQGEIGSAASPVGHMQPQMASPPASFYSNFGGPGQPSMTQTI